MQQSKICSFCNESGHHISECQTLNNLLCPICQKKGHTKKRCSKYDPTYTQKFECGYCRSQNLPFNGHTKYNCPVLKEIQCEVCDEFGHTTSVCLQKTYVKTPAREEVPQEIKAPTTPVQSRVKPVVMPAAPKKKTNPYSLLAVDEVSSVDETSLAKGAMLYSEMLLASPPTTPVQHQTFPLKYEEEEDVPLRTMTPRKQFHFALSAPITPTKQVDVSQVEDNVLAPPNTPVQRRAAPKKKTFNVNITLSPTKQVQKTPISLEDNEDIFARFLNANVQNLILSIDEDQKKKIVSMQNKFSIEATATSFKEASPEKKVSTIPDAWDDDE